MLKSILIRINKLINDVIDKISAKEPWYKYYDNTKKINYPDLTLFELINKTAESYPYNFAYEYYGKKVTYKEFIIKII